MNKRTGLIAKKIGNSSYYDDSGKSMPVTIIEVSDCIVSEIKTFALCGVERIIALPPSNAIYSPERNAFPDAAVSIFINDSW